MKLKFDIAGTAYTNARFLNLEEGAELLLVREPENVHDPKAIKVTTIDGMLLGYVPRTVTDMVFELLKHKPRITIFSKCGNSFAVSIHALMET
jgi:hypothetical protein